ncbi:MAG: peptide ABC transporter substrate-binding protein [Verrucomicrobia bacterium]|nr:peptide ABC transporter substrate-binding protein [Verrucomicrobiota bacterium]
MRVKILSILLLFLTSCSKSPLPKAEQLQLNIHSEPPSLDPRRATDVASISLIKCCFEGLTRIDPTNTPSLALAERYAVSADGMEYTFYLREALWSDGMPITAYDFETTWKTLLDPSFPSEMGSELYRIKNGQKAKTGQVSLDAVGIKALDAKTLHLTLEYPVPYLLYLLSLPIFFPTPNHITSIDPHWAENEGPHFVCSGPFLLEKWRHYNTIVCAKNPHYWDHETVRLDRLHFHLIEDENTEVSLFEHGQLDWAGFPLSSLPLDALQVLKKRADFFEYPIAGVYYYIFNTAAPPFDNANLRKALTLAIDRQALIANITQAGQTPALGFIPSTMWNSAYFKDADVKSAKHYLSLAIEELGPLPPITLLYNTQSAHHKIAQAIQEQWNKTLGIRVRLDNKEWKVFLDELRHHQFQIARMGGVASINDPCTFLDTYRYLSGTGNHSQWTNPQFSAILEEAEKTADGEKRLELLRKAETLLMEEMPIAPIYYYAGTYLKKPYVKGVFLSELNDVDYKWAYIERDD